MTDISRENVSCPDENHDTPTPALSESETASASTSEFSRNKQRKRKYLTSWENKWPWLVYDQDADVARCQMCVKAEELKLFKAEKRHDDAFISRGFSQWTKGPDRFAAHERATCHHEAVSNVAVLEDGHSVTAKLNAQIAEGQAAAREALTIIFTSLHYLACQNIAVRGHRHDDGNFAELLKLRSEDKPSLRQWLAKRNNWTSDIIQNEILEMLAHDVQRQIVSDIEKSPYIGLIADSTTDSDGLEQLSISIRYLHAETLVIHEAFLGMYNSSSSTADALTNAIKDVLLRLGIPFSKLCGHSFDGASNMSGRLYGVQAQIKAMQPKSMFVHCVNHSLDLALQETASDIAVVRNSLAIVRDCANIFRESAKRKQKLKQIADDISVSTETESGQSTFLLSLCPTRWCVRSRAITRMLKCWKAILLAMEELVSESGRGDMKSKIDGLRKQMSKANTYCGVLLRQGLFGPCEDLATALQSEKTTATGALHAAGVLLNHLERIRHEDEFDHLYNQSELDAAVLLMRPVLPRRLS